MIDAAILEWHLLEIEAISTKNSGLDVLHLEREVRAAPGGGSVFKTSDLLSCLGSSMRCLNAESLAP